MGASKITTIVLISIILTVVLVSLVNVGMTIFYKEPNYSDYCNSTIISPYEKANPTPADQLAYQQCNDNYNKAITNFNQIKFYIFAGLGFLLMLIGLFVPEIITKVVGLSAGGILVTQGIVYNFQNKIAVFITLVFILIIIGVLAVKVVKKMK